VDTKRKPSREAWALAEQLRKVLQVDDQVWTKKRFGWALSADKAIQAGYGVDRLLRLAQWGLDLGYSIGSIPQLVEKLPGIRRHVANLEKQNRQRKAGLTEELF
jgi:hypothetical protein